MFYKINNANMKSTQEDESSIGYILPILQSTHQKNQEVVFYDTYQEYLESTLMGSGCRDCVYNVGFIKDTGETEYRTHDPRLTPYWDVQSIVNSSQPDNDLGFYFKDANDELVVYLTDRGKNKIMIYLQPTTMVAPTTMVVPTTTPQFNMQLLLTNLAESDPVPVYMKELIGEFAANDAATGRDTDTDEALALAQMTGNFRFMLLDGGRINLIITFGKLDKWSEGGGLQVTFKDVGRINPDERMYVNLEKAGPTNFMKSRSADRIAALRAMRFIHNSVPPSETTSSPGRTRDDPDPNDQITLGLMMDLTKNSFKIDIRRRWILGGSVDPIKDAAGNYQMREITFWENEFFIYPDEATHPRAVAAKDGHYARQWPNGRLMFDGNIRRREKEQGLRYSGGQYWPALFTVQRYNTQKRALYYKYP